MITPEPPAGSEHYREGWRHGYEQAAIDRERSADAVRPDTAQVGRCGNACRYQPKNLALHSSCTLPHGHAGWHRDNGTGAEWGQTWTDPDPGQAPESPTASPPKAGRGGSGEAETATGTVQAPDVALSERAGERR